MRNGTLLFSMPWGVFTWTSLVVVNRKRSCRAVESNAGGTRQIVSQDDHGRARLAGGGIGFHERA